MRERKREVLTFWLYRAGERAISALPRGLVMPIAGAFGINIGTACGETRRGPFSLSAS